MSTAFIVRQVRASLLDAKLYQASDLIGREVFKEQRGAHVCHSSRAHNTQKQTPGQSPKSGATGITSLDPCMSLPRIMCILDLTNPIQILFLPHLAGLRLGMISNREVVLREIACPLDEAM